MKVIKFFLSVIVFFALQIIIAPATENIMATNKGVTRDNLSESEQNAIWYLTGFLSASLAVIISSSAVNTVKTIDNEKAEE